MKIDRILDANVNRVAEGIRVIEDIARFCFEDHAVTETLRKARHRVRKCLAHYDDSFVMERDSEHDIGKEISAGSTLDKKKDLKQLISANFKRVTEGLRVMEESLKIRGSYAESKEMESIRYEAYYLEKELLKKFWHEIPFGLYGITAENFSKGRKNSEVVKSMIEGGVKIIQYREKEKTLKEKFIECQEIREITREAGVKFIVNDNIDLALIVDADGVHIGQDDIPLSEVRKLVGDKIIGLSTHSPEQAEQAVKDGADYIGVGPIYRTFTKVNVCDPVGEEYLDYVIKNIDIPFVAIGGIKEHNLQKIVDMGAKRVAIVTDIVEAENIAEKSASVNKMILG